MKTLILTDEIWSELELSLESTDRGRRLLAELYETPRLPSDRELVRLARQKDDAPEAFRRAREYRDAARQAGEDTRQVINDLIVHTHGAGVGARVLSEWTGLQESRIYEIVAAARTSV